MKSYVGFLSIFSPPHTVKLSHHCPQWMHIFQETHSPYPQTFIFFHDSDNLTAAFYETENENTWKTLGFSRQGPRNFSRLPADRIRSVIWFVWLWETSTTRCSALLTATKIQRNEKEEDSGRLEKKEKGIGKEWDGLAPTPPKRQGPRLKMRLDWGFLTLGERERRFMGCLNTSMNNINK